MNPEIANFTTVGHINSLNNDEIQFLQVLLKKTIWSSKGIALDDLLVTQIPHPDVLLRLISIKFVEEKENDEYALSPLGHAIATAHDILNHAQYPLNDILTILRTAKCSVSLRSMGSLWRATVEGIYVYVDHKDPLFATRNLVKEWLSHGCPVEPVKK